MLTLSPEPFDSDAARRLVAALDVHLAERCPPAQRSGPNLRPEHVAEGRGTASRPSTAGEDYASSPTHVCMEKPLAVRIE